MSKTALQEYIFTAKYARIKNNKKETWEESVNRVMDMHEGFLLKRHGVDVYSALESYFRQAKVMYLAQNVLGAQRALQWGGDQLLKHHFRLYNCASSYANRTEFFSQLMYVLLTGAGVGYSVQTHHVDMLPELTGPLTHSFDFIIDDSIEGWANAVKALVNSYFYGERAPKFIFDKVRPKGSPISGGFKAPGPKPLEKALELLKGILQKAVYRQLTTLEVHEMSCIIADAVISGGIRRSALLAQFSVNDELMLKCKTGDWFYKKPHLGRANNSAVILPTTTKEEYDKIFNFTKEYGEPGLLLLDDSEIVLNPCAEVGMYPTLHNEDGTKSYGFSVCNLTEINGGKVKTQGDLLTAAQAAATLGTIQASYYDFDYLGKVTIDIVKRDSLIGVGITGIAENADILLNPEYLQTAASLVKSTNAKVAKIIGINAAARTTVIKPSGTSALLLNTSSGIHPFHYHKYIRNVQVNTNESTVNIIEEINPSVINDSVWSKDDKVISFPIEKDEDVIIKREDLSAIQFLEMVAIVQENWINTGTNKEHASYTYAPKALTHNVSNTITVKEDEWDLVKEYIWENKKLFCGISMISDSGDLDYPQAPFVKVLDEIELAELYGPAAILAGGLNVDGLHAFGDLWVAVDTALNKGESLDFSIDSVTAIIKENTVDFGIFSQFEFKSDGLMLTDVNAIIAYQKEKLKKKADWVRRFKNFAKKYLANDLRAAGHCLKQVSILHQWEQLKKMKPIHWEDYEWNEEVKQAGDDIAAACSGGSCEINI